MNRIFRSIAVVVATAALLVGCTRSAEDAEGTEPTEATTTAATQDQLEEVRIRIPSTLAFAAPFHLLPEDGELSEVAENLDIAEWATPDMLRAMLVNGESEVTAVPSYVGANLYNRDVDVQLAAVLVWGILHLLGPDGAPADWEELRGQTVMVPLPNDMPDLVFRYLAEANGLTPGEDFEIEYYSQAPEVVSKLVSGEGTFAVLPEHVATVALNQAGQNGRELGRMMNLQEEWGAATGGSERIPQAGIVVPGGLAEENPAVLAGVLDDLEAAVARVNAAEDADMDELAAESGVPAPVVKDVIPRLNLEVVPAAEAREELEEFYGTLAELSPDIIGGQLPDEDFYLADPR